MTRRTDLQRFFDQVEVTAGCWYYQGTLRDGYGRFHAGGATPDMKQAHRWVYEQIVGLIPAGLEIDHLCRVRHCVNPAHMEPVTKLVNMMRGVGPSVINSRKTQCPTRT